MLLPLRPPVNIDAVLGTSASELLRVLAVWRPISADGVSFVSNVESTAVIDDRLVPAAVDVFSGSLYPRMLLESGITSLTTQFGVLGQLLNAIADLVDG